MKICLLTNTYLPKTGGRELVVHNLATALSMINHEVTVVIPYSKQKLDTHDLPYKIERFGFRGSYYLSLTNILAILKLYQIAKIKHYDVINVHGVFIPGNWTYYLSKFCRNFPIVGTPHGDDIQKLPEINYGYRLDPILDRYISRNIRNFSHVTAISSAIRRDLEEIVIDREKIIKIPNGIWPSRFNRKIKIPEIRRRYNIPLNSIAIISIGRNHPKKGFMLGIEAIAKLIKEYKIENIVYLLVGREMEPIIEKADKLDIAKHLIATGEISQNSVIDLLRASNIYLSTSLIESFGITNIEAMSAGLPCVVSNVAGNNDIVNDSFGMLYESNNVDQLVAKLQILINDMNLRKIMSRNAKSAASKYDWIRIAGNYVKAYQKSIQMMN